MGTSYNPKIVTDGLVLNLDAGNKKSYPGTGTSWNDLSKTKYAGTLVNSPSFNLEGDGNLTFNGSNSYVSGGNTSVVNGNYTIDVWYKATGAPSVNDLYGGILFCQSNNINYGIWLSHSYTNQTISHSSTLNSFITTGNGTALNNTIINAVGIWNGTTQSVYINGVLSTSRSYTSNPYAVSPLYQVGRWGYAGYERYFNGKIYSVKLYNRALTSDETLQNFNAVKSRYGL